MVATAEGNYGEGSFFKNVTDQLKEFNKYLRTPEVNAFAISVNNALNSIVNGLVSAAKFFRDWGTQIVAVTTTIVGFTAAYKLLNAVMLATTALKAPGYFASLGESRPVIQLLISGFSRLQGVAVSSFAGITAAAGNFAAATRAVVGITPAMTAGLSGISLAAVQGAAGLASLTVGFAAIAIPVAALAGLTAIAYALTNIKTQGDLASDAIKRLSQGDYTKGTEAKARSELDAISERLKFVTAEMQKIDDVKSGKLKSYTPSDIGSALGASAIKAPIVDQSQTFQPMEMMGILPDTVQTFNQGNIESSEAAQQTKALYDYLLTLKQDYEKSLSELNNAGLNRAKQAAEIQLETIKNNAQVAMAPIRNQYSNNQMVLDERLNTLANSTDSSATTELAQVKQEKRQNQKNLYAEELKQADKDVGDAIASQQERLSKALGNQRQEIEDSSRIIIEGLQKRRQEIADKATEAAQKAGEVVTLTAGAKLASATKSAENYLERLKAQVAGLEEEAEGGVRSVGKLKELFNTGVWKDIPQEVKDSILEFAERSEKATKRTNELKDALAAQKKIDLGLDKANADLERWNAAITDPNATEAQRNFSTFQFQMQQALEVTAAKFKSGAITAIQYGQAIVDTNRAIQTAAAAGAEQTAASLIKQGQTSLEASQDPATRAKSVADRRNAEFAQTRKELSDAVTNGTKKQEDVNAILAKLDAAQKQVNLTPYSVGAAGRGAARKEENAADGMSAKIAQLKAEIAGANPELAKWNDMLANGKYTGRADEFRKMATEVGRLEEVLKKVQAAREAENNLKSSAKDGEFAAEEMRALIAATNERGKLLGIEREIFDLRRREQRKVQVVSNLPDEQGVNRAERLAAAQKEADQAVSQNATALVLKRQLDLNSEAENIKQSVETSLSARRAAGLKRISMDADADRRSLANSNLTQQEKANFETQLAETVAARKLQLQRQTENGLEKWIRESSDLEARMGDFASQGMTQLQDAFISFAETGKFSFSDLANWAIKELTRITLSNAFAQLMKGASSTGVSAEGILGALGKGVAAYFGANTVASGTGSNPNNLPTNSGGAIQLNSDVGSASSGVGLGSGTGFYHTGGMVGESSVYKSINSAYFSQAPKFHTGAYLKSDEVPAILQKGEGVFTAGQMSAIGRMNHDYTAIGGSVAEMSAAVSRMAASPSVPSSFTPTSNYDPSDRIQAAASKSGSAPPMTVNLNNQTGSNMGATAAQPRFDGEQWVVDIVLKHANQPGALRNSLQGMNGGR